VEQYERVDLFVRSKAGEIKRRLDHLHRQVLQLDRRTEPAARRRISVRRLERYSRIEGDVLKAGEEIQSLARFVAAQRLAFEKLLKKYQKWSGDAAVNARFRNDVLNRPEGFAQMKFDPLLSRWVDVLAFTRAPFEAGLTWKEPPPEEEKAGREWRVDSQDHARARLQEPVTAARELHQLYQLGSEAEIDTAFATLRLGDEAGHAAYWVHADDMVQLHVLLLQHFNLHKGKGKVASSARGTPSPRLSRSSTSNASAGSPDGGVEAIFGDNLQSFAVRRGGAMVKGIECMPGQPIEQAAFSVRSTVGGEAVVTLSGQPTSKWGGGPEYRRDTQRITAKRRAVPALFSRGDRAPVQRPESPALSEMEEEREWETSSGVISSWLENNPDVKPLACIAATRARFVGVGNKADRGLWARLDSQITLKKCSEDDPTGLEDDSLQEFPHSVLELRWEGQPTPKLVEALDASHLVCWKPPHRAYILLNRISD
jgi:hypothetical protein